MTTRRPGRTAAVWKCKVCEFSLNRGPTCDQCGSLPEPCSLEQEVARGTHHNKQLYVPNDNARDSTFMAVPAVGRGGPGPARVILPRTRLSQPADGRSEHEGRADVRSIAEETESEGAADAAAKSACVAARLTYSPAKYQLHRGRTMAPGLSGEPSVPRIMPKPKAATFGGSIAKGTNGGVLWTQDVARATLTKHAAAEEARAKMVAEAEADVGTVDQDLGPIARYNEMRRRRERAQKRAAARRAMAADPDFATGGIPCARPLTPFNSMRNAAVTMLALPPQAGHATFLTATRKTNAARSVVARYVRDHHETDWQREKRECEEAKAAKVADAKARADDVVRLRSEHAASSSVALTRKPDVSKIGLNAAADTGALRASEGSRGCDDTPVHTVWDGSVTDFGTLRADEREAKRQWDELAAQRLCRAAKDGDLALLRSLLVSLGARREELINRPWRGGTALWYAWRHWQAPAARLLLAAGASTAPVMAGIGPGEATASGTRAWGANRTKLCDPLGEIERHAASGRQHKMHAFWRIFRKVFHGATLHRAARDGDAELVLFLVRDCGEPLAEHNAGGFTPLHLAALEGRLGAAKALVDIARRLAAGEEGDAGMSMRAPHAVINARNAKGETPLDCCAVPALAGDFKGGSGDGNGHGAQLTEGRRAVAAMLRQHGGRQGEGEDNGAGGMTGGRGLGAAATSLWSHNDERIADPQALLRQPMHASMLEPGGLAQYAATGIFLKRKQTSWLPG